MNYLAHLFLSDCTQHALMGNLMGDFVKGNPDGRYPPAVVNGIKLHRKIDLYTDNHAYFIASKRRIRKENTRLSGILVDIFYDHFLTANWHRYSDIPLARQIDNWYALIAVEHSFDIPHTLAYVLEKMRSENWLLQYQSVAGIEHILKRFSRRIQFKNHLPTSIDDLVQHYGPFNDDFNAFFPQLIDHVDALKSL